MKVCNFFRNLIDYFQFFIIPPGLQKTSNLLMRNIHYLNRLYSLLFHKSKTFTNLSFPSNNASIRYRGDPYFEGYLEKKLAEMGITDIKKEGSVTNYSGDMDILKVNRLVQNDYIEKGYLIAPDWVRATVPLKNMAIFDNFNRSAKRAIKKLEEFGYSYYLIPASEILNNFYYEFYKPYIESIYCDSSILKDYSRLRFFAGKARVINIKCKGYTDALVYIIPAKDSKLYVYAAGLRDDLDGVSRELAQEAIYFFSIKFAVEHGFDSVDFGLTRSFLTDGVLNYKRKWGCKFSLPDNSVYDLAFRLDSEIIRDFIAHNPIFITDGGELSALFYFKTNPPDLESVLKEKKMWGNCGVSKIYFTSPSGFKFDVNEIEKSHPNLKMIQKDLNRSFLLLE